MRHGCIDDGPARGRPPLSLQLENLGRIWEHCIEEVLSVGGGREGRAALGVVLLVPDQFQRRDVTAMGGLLFERLGFGRVMILQESVAASFALGISCACVVDIGHTKTSVACVEDGLSLRNSRICMNWGGEQLDQLAARVLQLPEAQARLVKEAACHLEPQDSFERVAVLPALGELPLSPDQQQAVPLSMFFPEQSFSVDPYAGTEPSYQDPGDVLGHEFLQTVKAGQASQGTSQTSLTKRGKRKVRPGEALLAATAAAAAAAAAENPDPAAAEEKPESGELLTHANYRPVLPLDRAIFECIGRVGKTELIKRLFSHIVLIGGGSFVPGLPQALVHRVAALIPEASAVERVEVTNSKSQRAARNLLSWRGGAMVAAFESADSLWIPLASWQRDRSVAIRNHVPFSWRPHSVYLTSNRLESDPTLLVSSSTSPLRRPAGSRRGRGGGRRD